jgi:hypothetical protein
MLVRHYPTLMPGSAICSGHLLTCRIHHRKCFMPVRTGLIDLNSSVFTLVRRLLMLLVLARIIHEAELR